MVVAAGVTGRSLHKWKEYLFNPSIPDAKVRA